MKHSWGPRSGGSGAGEPWDSVQPCQARQGQAARGNTGEQAAKSNECPAVSEGSRGKGEGNVASPNA